MSSAICFNLDQSKMLSSGNGLRDLTKKGFGSEPKGRESCNTAI